MTREEAIRIIEKDIQIDVRFCTQEDVSRFTDALKMAIAALREQEERSKGCEWCESLDKKNKDFKCGDILARGVVEHTFWGDGRWYMQEPKFCPMCGRRLEEV